MHKRKSFQDPYTNANDFRLKWLEEEFIPYLNQWEVSVKKRIGFPSKAKLMMLLSQQTRLGINVTVKSFLELVRYIFTIPGVKFFLSERISQDPLENFFGCQRQRGGASENPNVQDFCKNTQALRVINSVCGSVPRGNCRGSKKLVDRQSDYNPLPKRQRIQASKEKLISEENRCHVFASPVVSSHDDSTAAVLVSKSVSKVAFNKINLSISENQCSSKITSNASGGASVIVTKQCLSTAQASCSQENNKCDMTPGADDATKEVGQQTFIVKNFTSNASGGASVIVTKQCLSTAQASCSQENNKCDVTPGADDATKEVRQQTFIAKNFEATVQNDSLEERACEVLRPGNENEIVVSGYGIALRRRDFWTLKELEWLNDQIINFYLRLIAEDSMDVYVYSTFFYLKLSRDGYEAVYRWTKSVDIFNFRLLIVPIHLGTHWCLATVELSTCTLSFYDSLKKENSTCLQTLKKYLVNASADAKLHVTDWHLVNCTDIPGQQNCSDCGIFTCMYARCLAEKCTMNFNQNDIPKIRHHMILELLSKTLIDL